MPKTSELRRVCSGRAWVEATTPYRMACAATQAPCSLCGGPIDYIAHHNHKLAFTVDHVIPLWAGGPELDPTNWQPAHRGCNSARGARENARRRIRDPLGYPRTHVRW